MSTTADTYVKLRDPSKDGDSRLNDMIALARELLDEDRWGDHYEYAVALQTLHLYDSQVQGNGGGPITAKTEGRLSVSFGSNPDGASDDWNSTKWGRELLDLLRTKVMLPRNRRI